MTRFQSSFDAAAQAIEHMANGNIDCMIVQNPFEMGVQTVRLLLAMQEAMLSLQRCFQSLASQGDKFTTGLRLIIPDAWENDEDALISKKDLESAVSAGTLEVYPCRSFVNG